MLTTPKLDFEQLFDSFSVSDDTLIFPDEVGEVEETQTFKEGSIRQIQVNAYERNNPARKKCIEYYGLNCYICHFNFEKLFGEIGKGFIHVHHIIPLSEINQEYEVNPIQDLRPLCPNCHAMIHRKYPPFTIEEIKDLLSKN
ncbi:HNH endonuclease [Microcoleus sp. MON2_D5]|uniref:HNH endonuclease n=1 Tax=Microcoleus sp. MON2_D5 TaxID=2818833 RepID=UPI002FD1BB99